MAVGNLGSHLRAAVVATVAGAVIAVAVPASAAWVATRAGSATAKAGTWSPVLVTVTGFTANTGSHKATVTGAYGVGASYQQAVTVELCRGTGSNQSTPPAAAACPAGQLVGSISASLNSGTYTATSAKLDTVPSGKIWAITHQADTSGSNGYAISSNSITVPA
jgi:hypothetical protein